MSFCAGCDQEARGGGGQGVRKGNGELLPRTQTHACPQIFLEERAQTPTLSFGFVLWSRLNY